MTYLILHKVRGEPAFDIAQKQCEGSEPCQPNCGLFPECKNEETWIIPTSGHRCYPYWKIPLGEIVQNDVFYNQAVPEGWPDHYETQTGGAPKPDFNIMTIISPMMTKFKRRL